MELTQKLRLSDLRLEAQTRQTQTLLRTPDDWRRFSDILSDMQDRLRAEDSAFARGFAKRVQIARQVILREQLGLAPHEPSSVRRRPAQSLRPSQKAAEARVYADHSKRKEVIKEDAIDAMQKLHDQLRARDAPSPSNCHRHDPSPDGSPKRRGPRRA